MSVCRSIVRRAVAVSLPLALSACASSPPTYYYTLLPTGGTPAVAEARYQIEVLPVDVPAQVDVPQMVVRTGGGEVTPVETRRWIAPLPNELRGALSWQLTHQLGVKDVYGFSGGDVASTYRIHLRVTRFDSAPGAYARIDALWSAGTADAKAAAPLCSSSAQISVMPGYAELAQGHQQALAKIAAEIAANIGAAQTSGKPPSCGANAG